MDKNVTDKFNKLSFVRKIDVYRLAIKYWWQGDEFDFAFEYAVGIVMAFKKR